MIDACLFPVAGNAAEADQVARQRGEEQHADLKQGEKPLRSGFDP